MSHDVSSATLLECDSPGNLDDLTLENRKLCSSQFMNYWMQGEIDANHNVVSHGRKPLTQYFNGTLTPFETTQKPQPVTWIVFPKTVRILIFGKCPAADMALRVLGFYSRQQPNATEMAVSWFVSNASRRVS